MGKIKKMTSNPLFLSIFCLFLVMAVNIIQDTLAGKFPLQFFTITISDKGYLYGRIIDILNNGSLVAILAIGMTLVVASSAGTDISVGSVMCLAGCATCVTLAGYGNRDCFTYNVPLAVGFLIGILIACLCGAFNGALVAFLKIQPMVATLVLYIAARAIGLVIMNDKQVYIKPSSFNILGGYTGPIPTPIILAAICVVLTILILKKTALGLYIQSVGINSKASRIAGLNSKWIIFFTYVVCGLFAGIAGIIYVSRHGNADAAAIGYTYEMDAILAVALGGNSLAGGKFNLVGSIVGAYTIQAITTTLLALGVSASQQPVFKAIVVIIIVAIQSPAVKSFMKKREMKKIAKEGGAAA